MKTTLTIHDTVMKRLKQEPPAREETMSELVETALRALFHPQRQRATLQPLPSFDSRGHLVDIADRDALYRAMEEGA